MCLACAKKSLMLFKKLQLRWKYRSTYKNAEYKAYKAKKQKDYKNASKWYAVAAMLRKATQKSFIKKWIEVIMSIILIFLGQQQKMQEKQLISKRISRKKTKKNKSRASVRCC